MLIASFTQYVGTKCATVCTAEPMSDSGIQAPPKNVMSMPSRLPTYSFEASRPCSRLTPMYTGKNAVTSMPPITSS